MQVEATRREYLRDEFFVYVHSMVFFEPLDVIKFDTDADFELQRLSMFMTPDGSPQTEESRYLAQVDINIFDTATGRNVFAAPLSTAELFGDGRVPFILPTTHWFKRGTQARIDTTGGSDFENGNLWLALIGRKRFAPGDGELSD
jgi:hypothetical protein